MSAEDSKPDISDLIQQEKWAEAEQAIRRELLDDPEDHWLVTQLGVTLYERNRYAESLREFERSARLVPDCPLTMWNVAGALAALGRPREALDFYLWLLRSRKTPDDDPCWESDEWTRALKTDVVYRAAGCFEQLNKPEVAEQLFVRYVTLLLEGHQGTYPAESAIAHIRRLRESRRVPTRFRFQEMNQLFESAGLTPPLPKRQSRPAINLEELSPKS